MQLLDSVVERGNFFFSPIFFALPYMIILISQVRIKDTSPRCQEAGCFYSVRPRGSNPSPCSPWFGSDLQYGDQGSVLQLTPTVTAVATQHINNATLDLDAACNHVTRSRLSRGTLVHRERGRLGVE